MSNHTTLRLELLPQERRRLSSYEVVREDKDGVYQQVVEHRHGGAYLQTLFSLCVCSTGPSTQL